MNIKKCASCGAEMHMLKNWKSEYMGDVGNLFYETTTIYAGRHENAFSKGPGIVKEKPSMFICTNCGKYELFFSKEQVNHIMSIENDSDYDCKYDAAEEDVREEYVEKPINLSRTMSRLRRDNK